jgi:hypothetical protein
MSPENLERQIRQVLFMLLAAIALEFGRETAARIVKGLYEKYAGITTENPVE